MPTDLLKSAAAHESWAATTDRTARTAPARAALEAKFLEQAAGDPVRAGHLRQAYYLRLAAKSVAARRKHKATAVEGEPSSADDREVT